MVNKTYVAENGEKRKNRLRGSLEDSSFYLKNNMDCILWDYDQDPGEEIRLFKESLRIQSCIHESDEDSQVAEEFWMEFGCGFEKENNRGRSYA